jgi:hypothetical protein
MNWVGNNVGWKTEPSFNSILEKGEQTVLNEFKN